LVAERGSEWPLAEFPERPRKMRKMRKMMRRRKWDAP
jgi:hypothetical protein